MKQYLYIVTGLPYSGKSTLIKALVKRFGFNVASTDEMIEKEHYDVPKMKQDDWNIVYDRAYKKLEKLLKSGKSVIFDGGSLLKSERDKLKKIANECNVPWKLIYLNTSKQEIVERRKRNLTSKERDQLADETMEKAFGMFEEPNSDENIIIYDQRIPLDVWINTNIF